jgi:DNA-binding CsgD family transcriptional regulator
MERLTGKELRRLSEFLRDLYQLRTHEEFSDHVITALPVVTEGEFTSYNEFYENGRPGFYKCDQVPYCPDPVHYVSMLSRYVHQHPLIMHFHHTKAESAQMITDFVPMRTFQKTALYNEFYRPLKIPYLLSMAVKGGSDLTITVSRHQEKREFRETNRTIFNVLRPHLKQALENALVVTQMQNQLAAMNQVMEEGQQALISVTENGRIRFVTPYAQRLLKQYGIQTRAGFDQLPTRLYDWLTHYQRQLNRSDDVPPELDPLLIQGESGGLSIRLIVRGSQYLLILEERRAAHVTKDFASFGLSTRESEILGWVAQGKTNPEIGTILGISPRTVQKHLERIYSRLGVENRHAAMRMVFDVASRQECSSRNDF